MFLITIRNSMIKKGASVLRGCTLPKICAHSVQSMYTPLAVPGNTPFVPVMSLFSRARELTGKNVFHMCLKGKCFIDCLPKILIITAFSFHAANPTKHLVASTGTISNNSGTAFVVKHLFQTHETFSLISLYYPIIKL